MWTLHATVKPHICTAGVYIDIFSPLVRMPLGQCEPAHGSQTTHMYCRGLYWYFFTTYKNATRAMWTLHVTVKPLIHTAGVCIDIFSPLARIPLGQCEPCQATRMYCRGLYWYLSPLSTHLAEVCREATVKLSYPDCQDYRDHTFFHALTFTGFRGSWTRSRRLSVHCLNKKHLPRDPANVNALKQTCLIVILAFYMTPWKLPSKTPEKSWKCCFDTTVHIQRRHFVFRSFLTSFCTKCNDVNFKPMNPMIQTWF